jgi:two-component system CheB/CheR fusion protein
MTGQDEVAALERRIAELETESVLQRDRAHHQLRNLLSLVRSITRRTIRPGRDVDDLAARLEARFDALARLQTGIGVGQTSADLETIIYDALLAHAMRPDDKVQISGPDVRLGPKAAQALGLAIHELVSNAIEHGSLALEDGRLAIRWRLDDWLEIDWHETGPVMPPTPLHDGFGLEMIRQTLPYELDAQTAIIFEPDGLRIGITLPV